MDQEICERSMVKEGRKNALALRTFRRIFSTVDIIIFMHCIDQTKRMTI